MMGAATAAPKEPVLGHLGKSELGCWEVSVICLRIFTSDFKSVTWSPARNREIFLEQVGAIASRRTALSLAALLASATALEAGSRFAPWAESGFASAEARQLSERDLYPKGRPSLPFSLDATVAFDQRTPWTQSRAIRQLRKTAAILEACGVSIRDVTLVRLALPPRDRRIDTTLTDPVTGVPPAVARLAKQLPATASYPAAFLIGRVAGTASLAVSYRPQLEDEATAPYFNTAWIAYQSHWLPRPDESYSPLAHELAHLLCRCGHTETAQRHLLHSARNFLSSAVLPDDCKRIQDSPLLYVND